MGKSESRAKDAAMAASLMRTTTHTYDGVARHKRARLAGFMAGLSTGISGSAAYRRMKQR